MKVIQLEVVQVIEPEQLPHPLIVIDLEDPETKHYYYQNTVEPC